MRANLIYNVVTVLFLSASLNPVICGPPWGLGYGTQGVWWARIGGDKEEGKVCEENERR